MNRLNKIPVIASIIMLLIALIGSYNLDNGYFTLLRIIVCGTAVYMAIFAGKTEKQHWMWVAGFIAILFNPLIRIEFESELWQIIDFITIIVFFTTIFALNRKTNVFTNKAFKNTVIAAAIFCLVAVLGGLLEEKRDNESRQARRQKKLTELALERGKEIKEIKEVKDKVYIKGERESVEFRKDVDDEKIKKIIEVTYFNPRLSYENDDIKVKLVKAYYKNKWLIIKIQVSAINEDEIIYPSGINYVSMYDNLGNSYLLKSEPRLFNSEGAGLPKSDFKNEMHPGTRGTIYLFSDDKILEKAAMLWLKVVSNEICNDADVLFKIPTAYIGSDFQELISKNVQKSIELSKVKNAKQMRLNDFLEMTTSIPLEREAILREYKILQE